MSGKFNNKFEHDIWQCQWTNELKLRPSSCSDDTPYKVVNASYAEHLESELENSNKFAGQQENKIDSLIVGNLGFINEIKKLSSEIKALREALKEAHDCMGTANQTAWMHDVKLIRQIISEGRIKLTNTLEALGKVKS